MLNVEKPTAEIVPKSYPTMVLGDKLTLTCKVSESTSKIEWKKNDAPGIPRATISEEDHQSTLVIEKVDIGDSGDYSCVAHNQAGYGFSTIKIKVRGKIESFMQF